MIDFLCSCILETPLAILGACLKAFLALALALSQ